MSGNGFGLGLLSIALSVGAALAAEHPRGNIIAVPHRLPRE